MTPKKGFTLIELLVVIAIIGILASIVLVSLGGARNKAKDVRVQADLVQVKSIAEMIADEESTGYNNLCASNTLNVAHTTYNTQLTTIQSDINTQVAQNVVCHSNVSDYCAIAQLTGTNRFTCTDSSGITKSAVNAACNNQRCY